MIANIKRYAMRRINLKSMAQQTAVQFLINYMLENFHLTDYTVMVVFEQAKQMEKEQIVEAFYEGMKTNPFDPNRGRGKMYYDETYKKD